MAALSRIRKWTSQQTEDQRAAQQRMALFPDKAEVIFVGEDIWVVSYLAWRRQVLASLISITASGSIRRQTMYISWYSLTIPTVAYGVDTVLTLASQE